MTNWISDIETLRKTIFALHPNPLHTTSNLEDNFDALISNLNEYSDSKIKVELIKIVAQVGDAHTSFVHWTSDFMELPFRFKLFSDGIYVTQISERYIQALGSRLLSINGFDAETLYSKIRQIVASENESFPKLIVPEYLGYLEILQGLKLLPRRQ